MMTKCNRKYESRKIIRYRQLIQKKIEALLACIINELTLPARQASVVEGTLIIRLDTGRSCAQSKDRGSFLASGHDLDFHSPHYLTASEV